MLKLAKHSGKKISNLLVIRLGNGSNLKLRIKIKMVQTTLTEK